MVRLAAWVPKPRVNLTRFHGVFTPNSKHRAWVTPAKRGKGNQWPSEGDIEAPTPVERRTSMTPDRVRGRLWAQRLKRVFGINITTCRECGGAVKVIACIEGPVVMPKALRGAGSREDTQPPRQAGPSAGGRPVAARPGTPRGSVRLTPSNSPRSTQIAVTRRAGRGLVGLMVGMGRNTARVRPELSRISGRRRDARTLSSFGLSVGHETELRLSFL